MRTRVAEQAMAAWMQDVEDRLKVLHRRVRRQPASTTEGAVGKLTAGQLRATQQLGIGWSEAASTPGSVVGKVLIVDTDGNHLGYLPLYDDIA